MLNAMARYRLFLRLLFCMWCVFSLECVCFQNYQQSKAKHARNQLRLPRFYTFTTLLSCGAILLAFQRVHLRVLDVVRRLLCGQLLGRYRSVL